MSSSLVISPVDACPAGVGLSVVQCSPRPCDGAGVSLLAAGGSAAATGAGSLSGALVATSGSPMVMARLIVRLRKRSNVPCVADWERDVGT